MTEIRALVIIRKETDLPRDHCTNTIYFDTDSPFTWPEGPLAPLDELQLAKDLRDVFRARSLYPTGTGVEVKMYDMQDAQPRQVKGHANWASLTGASSGEPGPREVACCLSFRGGQNTPRTRGRIFVGPWTKTSCAERPDASVRQQCINLATGIANVGGVNIDWCVRSTITGDQVPVKFAWVDDEWDTVRSRGLKATLKTPQVLDE